MSQTKEATSSNNEKVCRIVIQQCRNATLRFDSDDSPVSIGVGMVVFTCFLQGAAQSHLDNIVKSILNVKLCEDPNPDSTISSATRDSVLHHKLDILVIPQATLGGRLKGKAVQYHDLVAKSLGEELFTKLVIKLRESIEVQGTPDHQGHVASGVYGARQILNMETNGPFTHIFEF